MMLCIGCVDWMANPDTVAMELGTCEKCGRGPKTSIYQVNPCHADAPNDEPNSSERLTTQNNESQQSSRGRGMGVGLVPVVSLQAPVSDQLLSELRESNQLMRQIIQQHATMMRIMMETPSDDDEVDPMSGRYLDGTPRDS